MSDFGDDDFDDDERQFILAELLDDIDFNEDFSSEDDSDESLFDDDVQENNEFVPFVPFFNPFFLRSTPSANDIFSTLVEKVMKLRLRLILKIVCILFCVLFVLLSYYN